MCGEPRDRCLCVVCAGWVCVLPRFACSLVFERGAASESNSQPATSILRRTPRGDRRLRAVFRFAPAFPPLPAPVRSRRRCSPRSRRAAGSFKKPTIAYLLAVVRVHGDYFIDPTDKYTCTVRLRHLTMTYRYTRDSRRDLIVNVIHVMPDLAPLASDKHNEPAPLSHGPPRASSTPWRGCRGRLSDARRAGASQLVDDLADEPRVHL